MKKLVTLCLFSLAMLFTTQSLTAQNKIEINSISADMAKKLNHALKLNKDAYEKVYQAYKAYNTDMYTINQDYTANSNAFNSAKKGLQDELNTTMKGILNDQQFNRYIIMTEQQGQEILPSETEIETQKSGAQSNVKK